MMSFMDIRVKPQTQASYLRSDWSAEELKFKDNVRAFKDGIAFANVPVENPRFSFTVEIETPKGVEKSAVCVTEKIHGITAGAVEKTVVFTNVATPHVEVAAVPNATNATKESIVPTKKAASADVIDDIFGEATPKQSTFEDDFFSEPSSAAKPTVKAADAEPFTPPAKIENPKEAPAIQSLPVPKDKPNAYPPIDMSAGPEAMEGFNEAVFEKVNRHAHDMLHWLPNDDIRHFSLNISEYAVNVDLDYLRGNPTVLSDKLIEIQAKRDALYTATIRWVPVITAAKQAEKYVLSAGLAATEAKPVDKRIAQIKLAIPTFWLRHSDIMALESQVEKTFEHLCNWYECISRLISSMQMNNKVQEISRGDIPFDGGKPSRDDTQFNSEMSQPISVPKVSGCESFSAVGKTSSKFSAGENDW